MLANERIIVISLIVGCIPYLIKKLPTRGGHALEIRALFWSVQYTTHRQWIARIPLIERLWQAIWTIITHLYEGDNDHSQK